MDIRNQIIKNLSGRSSHVNAAVAANGIGNFEAGLRELRAMTCAGIVEVNQISLPGKNGDYVRGQYAKLYRLGIGFYFPG